MTILDVQKALIAAGFNPGSPDGVMGPRTRAAIMAFQRAKGLEVDSIVGPVTFAALFGKTQKPAKADTAIPLHMPWLIEAARHVGLKEGVGKANNNKIIMDWADGLDVTFPNDETPWCGLYVGHCVGSALPDDPLPNGLLGARKWLNYGMTCTPQLGSVLVFWRESIEDWRGHVGFYWAEDKDNFHVLGGNQSNKVSIMRVAKNRLLGARWPASLPTRGITRKASAEGVLISVNEA